MWYAMVVMGKTKVMQGESGIDRGRELSNEVIVYL